MTGPPAPRTRHMTGHLSRWTFDPLDLLAEGARCGPVFRLRLWRSVLVGYRPEWNREILGDLETFRSHGSLSGLTPYLSGGVVGADVPAHDARRRELNPHFHARSLDAVASRLRKVADEERPWGEFEALAWSSRVIRRMLNAVFFAGRLDDALLDSFLSPLQRPAPAPFVPRPILFARLNAAVAAILADPPDGSLAAALADCPGAVEEIRVALAAGYDTTAHTLAWAVWHLAAAPEWRSSGELRAVLDEVTRLYPAGWLGSRVAARDIDVTGVHIKAGTMVLYSPYLTHRDPDLWPEPEVFRPERFISGRPAWGFIPFSAGRRTCLGVHLAKAMLYAALGPLTAGTLTRVRGAEGIRAGITLRPAIPLWLSRSAR